MSLPPEALARELIDPVCKVTTDDQNAYLDASLSVDSDEGVPLAVARKAFGGDPKDIIKELNSILVA